MPQPYKRSRSLRRLNIRVLGKSVLRYKERKPGKAKCGNCGMALKGVSRKRPKKMQKIPITGKSPERPYSNLCSRCMRLVMIDKARLQ
ncbi:50S ribosomal protein L34e [Candidatus Woesearchaeota archaeon]|nr:50S ribosomal protein L34e [Candidatus Woesearchaeota archaeon]